MEREYEAKGLITKSEFENLISSLKIVEVKEQQNTYVDTSCGFFKSKDSALRLRIINGEYIFSLKQQNADGATEWNEQITQLQFDTILKDKAINLEHFKCPYNQQLDNLNLITITTKRYVCLYQKNIIELDMTTFKNTIDYEIEVESDNLTNASMIVKNLASTFDLNIKKSYPKIARYFMYN